MYDVITFGSATRDVFLRSQAMDLHKEHGITEACFAFGAKINVEEIALETGGGGTNTAVTFSRLARLRTAAVVRVGNDASGDDIINALKKDRVSASLVQRDPKEHTGFSTIILSREAERTILVHRGASARLEARQVPWSRLRAKLFYVSSLGGDLDLFGRIVARAKRINAKVYFNPGNGELKRGRRALAPLLRQTDLLFLNRDEAAMLTGKKRTGLGNIIKAIRKISPHAVITDGREGAYAVSPDDALHADILPTPRVNLTGAGDAFCSAYAVGFLLYHDRKTALALGTLNATEVVQHTGAKVGILRGLPSKREIKCVKIKKISL